MSLPNYQIGLELSEPTSPKDDDDHNNHGMVVDDKTPRSTASTMGTLSTISSTMGNTTVTTNFSSSEYDEFLSPMSSPNGTTIAAGMGRGGVGSAMDAEEEERRAFFSPESPSSSPPPSREQQQQHLVKSLSCPTKPTTRRRFSSSQFNHFPMDNDDDDDMSHEEGGGIDLNGGVHKDGNTNNNDDDISYGEDEGEEGDNPAVTFSYSEHELKEFNNHLDKTMTHANGNRLQSQLYNHGIINNGINNNNGNANEEGRGGTMNTMNASEPIPLLRNRDRYASEESRNDERGERRVSLSLSPGGSSVTSMEHWPEMQGLNDHKHSNPIHYPGTLSPNGNVHFDGTVNSPSTDHHYTATTTTTINNNNNNVTTITDDDPIDEYKILDPVDPMQQRSQNLLRLNEELDKERHMSPNFNANDPPDIPSVNSLRKRYHDEENPAFPTSLTNTGPRGVVTIAGDEEGRDRYSTFDTQDTDDYPELGQRRRRAPTLPEHVLKNIPRLVHRNLPLHQSKQQIAVTNKTVFRSLKLQYILSHDWFHVILRLPTAVSVFWLLAIWTFVILIFAAVYRNIDTRDPEASCGLGKAGEPILFSAAFAFSLETCTTVGYGLPNSVNSFFEASCSGLQTAIYFQMVWSMIFNAFLFAFLFARLARCESRGAQVMFANKAIVENRDGKWFIHVRVYDMDSSQPVVEATVRMYCVSWRDYKKQHTRHMTQPHLLHEMRILNPDDNLGAQMFTSIPANVTHQIDCFSPLAPPKLRRNAGQQAIYGNGRGLNLREVDQDVGGRGCPCPVCGQTFASQDLLQKHIKYQSLVEALNGKIPIEGSHRDTSLTTQASKKPTVVTETQLRNHLQDKEIMVVVEGIEPMVSGTFQALQSYKLEDITFGGRYAPCMSQKGGKIFVDIDNFHTILAPSESSIRNYEVGAGSKRWQ